MVASGPKWALPSGYMSRWWTQKRNGSIVGHWKPSGTSWSTGSFMDSRLRLHQGRDDVAELAERTHLERPAATRAVVVHRRVRPSPVGLRLRVQPEDAAGLRGNHSKGLDAVGPVVGTRIAADDHGRARRDGVGEVAIDESIERPAVVTVAVVAEYAAPLDEAVDVDLVASGFEEIGHFGDPIDEREAAHTPQLVVQRVHQGEGELSELGDRSAHIAQQDELGSMRMTP